MSLVNADKHRCKGLWTREQGKEKSVIDYVMTNTEHLNSIKEMIIDETKEYATYRLDQQNQDLKKTYFDNNIILLKIDLHTETIQTKERKIITTKGYKQYSENIEQLQISKLIATGQIQNNYQKWREAVKQSIKRVTKKKRKTNTRRDIRQLMKMGKNLRKELSQSTDTKKRQHLKDRIRTIKEHIVDRNKEIRGIKVKKIAEQIRSNINNVAKIWEVKRKIKQKRYK